MGMSSLHSWIKCLECVLHIAYRLDVKKWKVKHVVIVERKKYIQNGLRRELGLLIDVPKPGFGSTNDGDPATFFRNHQIVAHITGLNEDL